MVVQSEAIKAPLLNFNLTLTLCFVLFFLFVFLLRKHQYDSGNYAIMLTTRTTQAAALGPKDKLFLPFQLSLYLSIRPAGGDWELTGEGWVARAGWGRILGGSRDLPFPSAARTLSAHEALSLRDWTKPLTAHLTLSLSCTWLCFRAPFTLSCLSLLLLSTLRKER